MIWNVTLFQAISVICICYTSVKLLERIAPGFMADIYGIDKKELTNKNKKGF